MTLYETRKMKNRIALAASGVAALIGLFWLEKLALGQWA
mgnify:CR=1 FL=1